MEFNVNIDKVLKIHNSKEYGPISLFQDNDNLYITNASSIIPIELSICFESIISNDWYNNFIFIGLFLQNSILITSNSIDLKLTVLKNGSYLKIPLPIKLVPIEGYNLKLKIELYSNFIIILIQNILFKWKFNLNISYLDDTNLNAFVNGVWEKTILYNMEQSKIYFLNGISPLYTNEIIGVYFSISSFYYCFENQTIFSKMFIMKLNNGDCNEIKSYVVKICIISKKINFEEKNLNETVLLSYNTFPIVSIIINQYSLLCYQCILHGIIISYVLPSKSNVSDIKWDKSGNLLLCFTNDGLFFSTSRLGNLFYKKMLNVFENNELMKSYENENSKILIASNSDISKIICTNYKKVVFFSVESNFIRNNSLEVTDFISTMVKFATKEYFELLELKLKFQDFKSSTFREIFSQRESISLKVQTIFKSCLGYIVSSEIEDKDNIYLLDIVFELLSKYIILEIELISYCHEDLFSKSSKVEKLIHENIISYLLLDSNYQLFYDHCYSMISFFSNYFQSFKLTTNNNEISCQYILTSQFLQQFINAFVEVYSFKLSFELYISPISIMQRNQNVIKDNYNITRIYSIIHRFKYFGDTFLTFTSENESNMFKCWCNWYTFLFTKNSILFIDKIVQHDYSHILVFYLNRLEYFGTQGKEIYSNECMSDLHSVIYIFIISANFDDCFQLIDILAKLRIFSKKMLPNNLLFLREFSDQLTSKKVQMKLMESSIIQSLARLLGSYFLNKPIFLPDPIHPHPIISTDMENIEDVNICIDSTLIKQWLIQLPHDTYCISYCIHLYIISGKINEAIEIALILNDWMPCYTLIHLMNYFLKIQSYSNRSQTPIDNPCLNIYENKIEMIINDIIERYVENENNSYFENLLFNIISMPSMTDNDNVLKVCELIYNNFVLPRVKSLSLFVSGNIFLQKSSFHSYQNVYIISKDDARDIDYQEIYLRQILQNLINLFFKILKWSNILDICIDIFLRKKLTNPTFIVKNNLKIFLLENNEYKNVKLTKLFSNFFDILYFIYLRDEVTFFFRKKDKYINCDISKWINYSNHCFVKLKKLVKFLDIISDTTSFRKQILLLLLELQPDLSMVKFMVKWEFNEFKFQDIDIHLNNLLSILLYRWKYIVYNEVENSSSGNSWNYNHYNNKTFSYIYYDMLSQNLENLITFNDIEDNDDFSSFLKEFLYSKFYFHKGKIMQSSTNEKDFIVEKNMENDYSISQRTLFIEDFNNSQEMDDKDIWEIYSVIKKLIDWNNNQCKLEYTDAIKITLDINIILRYLLLINKYKI